MKKCIINLIVLCILTTSAFAGQVYEKRESDDIVVAYNYREIKYDVKPIIKSGRTFVPMRKTFEAMYAEVSWDDVSKTAIAVKDDVTVKITQDASDMYKNGERIELEAAAVNEDGRILIPLRAVSEAFECKVEWFEDTRLIMITKQYSEDMSAEPYLDFYKYRGKTLDEIEEMNKNK